MDRDGHEPASPSPDTLGRMADAAGDGRRWIRVVAVAAVLVAVGCSGDSATSSESTSTETAASGSDDNGLREPATTETTPDSDTVDWWGAARPIHERLLQSRQRGAEAAQQSGAAGIGRACALRSRDPEFIAELKAIPPPADSELAGVHDALVAAIESEYAALVSLCEAAASGSSNPDVALDAAAGYEAAVVELTFAFDDLNAVLEAAGAEL